MGTIISRMKENQKLKKLKTKVQEQTEKGMSVLSRKKSSCLKGIRRDKRAEKIYEEIRQRDEEEFSIEV